MKLNKDGYTVDEKRYHPARKYGLDYVYRAEIPTGYSWWFCYEVIAPTYREAKQMINDLVYREHRMRPTWAK